MLNQVIAKLVSAGIDSPRLEARMIIAHVLKLEPNTYFDNHKFSKSDIKQIQEITNRRINSEPLDKIFGYKDFYKHRFMVNSDVLSPRFDSEIMVEEAVVTAKKIAAKSILEIGVGSGCLLLSVVSELFDVTAIGFDKSKKALKIARANTNNLGLNEVVKLYHADYFKDEISGSFDIILSNPPYIPSKEIALLDVEVKNYDPLMALDGGDDGLAHYKKIACIARNLLNDGGYIFIEAGISQSHDIQTIFVNSGLSFVKCLEDFGGIERCVICKK